jgi:hypothetical protein
MRSGVISNTGMLIAINNDWSGANASAEVPIPIPNMVAKNVPAHVGHPVNRPVNIPNPTNQFALAFFGLL